MEKWIETDRTHRLAVHRSPESVTVTRLCVNPVTGREKSVARVTARAPHPRLARSREGEVGGVRKKNELGC